VQHINHHDIAGYNSCIIYANAVGEPAMVEPLNQMLMDEKLTDDALNAVSLKIINS